MLVLPWPDIINIHSLCHFLKVAMVTSLLAFLLERSPLRLLATCLVAIFCTCTMYASRTSPLICRQLPRIKLIANEKLWKLTGCFVRWKNEVNSHHNVLNGKWLIADHYIPDCIVQTSSGLWWWGTQLTGVETLPGVQVQFLYSLGFVHFKWNHDN